MRLYKESQSPRHCLLQTASLNYPGRYVYPRLHLPSLPPPSFFTSSSTCNFIPPRYHTKSSKLKRTLNPYITAFFRLFGESSRKLMICAFENIQRWGRGMSVPHPPILSPHTHTPVIPHHFLLLNVLTEDEVIQDFLWMDSCAKLADNVGLYPEAKQLIS